MRKLLAVALCVAALPASAGKPQSRLLSGYYYWAQGHEALHPCGLRQSYFVVGDEKLLRKLREASAKVAQAKGDGPVYVELMGVTEREVRYPDDDSDYGVYRLTAMKRVAADGPADCPAH